MSNCNFNGYCVHQNTVNSKECLCKEDECIFQQEQNDKPLLIVKREEPESHYELHFNNRVEFITLDGRKLKEPEPVKVGDL